MLKFDCPECTCKLQLTDRGVESLEPMPPSRELTLYYLKEFCGTNSGKGIAGGFSRFGKAAKILLGLANNDIMKATRALDEISAEMRSSGLNWTLDTILSNYPSWHMKNLKKKAAVRGPDKCGDSDCKNTPALNEYYCQPCLDMRR